MQLKVGLVSVAYREARFLPKFLKSIPDWVDEKLVLVSEKPWHGEELKNDGTAGIANKFASAIEYPWESEHEQRNAGQEYFTGFDWIIVLDPDEFLDDLNWSRLKEFIHGYTKDSNRAFVTRQQRTYWKHGYIIKPPEDYKQIILVKPTVRFRDKRVVDCSFGFAPVELDHFSWARTDLECWNKITHYGHAHEINAEDWFGRVWRKWTPEMENLHPLTPEALKKAEPVLLPKELQELDLWP